MKLKNTRPSNGFKMVELRGALAENAFPVSLRDAQVVQCLCHCLQHGRVSSLPFFLCQHEPVAGKVDPRGSKRIQNLLYLVDHILLVVQEGLRQIKPTQG